MQKAEIQPATIKDIPKIKAMINRESVDNGTIKTRSLKELYSRTREIYVIRDGKVVVASGALQIHSDNLAEINCLVVSPEYRRKGLGRKMLQRLIKDAKTFGIPRVIGLTYVPEFLISGGFVKGNKEELSQKINNDCVNCDRFPDVCKAEFFIKYL